MSSLEGVYKLSGRRVLFYLYTPGGYPQTVILSGASCSGSSPRKTVPCHCTLRKAPVSETSMIIPFSCSRADIPSLLPSSIDSTAFQMRLSKTRLGLEGASEVMADHGGDPLDPI